MDWLVYLQDSHGTETPMARFKDERLGTWFLHTVPYPPNHNIVLTYRPEKK